MLQIGFLEIAIILIIGLLVIGPERLPELVKNLLKFYKKINSKLGWKAKTKIDKLIERMVLNDFNLLKKQI